MNFCLPVSKFRNTQFRTETLAFHLSTLVNPPDLVAFRICASGNLPILVDYLPVGPTEEALQGLSLRWEVTPASIEFVENTFHSRWLDVLQMVEARQVTVVEVAPSGRSQEDLILAWIKSWKEFNLNWAFRWELEIMSAGQILLLLRGLPDNGQRLNNHPVFSGPDVSAVTHLR